jgi:hypothetical protein
MSLSALLILSACTPTIETIVETRYIERNIPIQARPAPLNLNDVEWTVVNSSNIEEFARQFGDDPSRVFIVTTIQGYQNLSLNLAELRRYIEQQQDLIVYYEQAVAPGWESNIVYSPETLR